MAIPLMQAFAPSLSLSTGVSPVALTNAVLDALAGHTLSGFDMPLPMAKNRRGLPWAARP